MTVTADIRVYGLALLLSLASGILFGLLPARQIWQTDAARVMKGAPAPVLFRRFTLRDLLLGLQIALCTLLVTASLVAVRGMQRSLHAPIGFQPQGAMLATTDMQMAGYSNKDSLPIQKRMLEEDSRHSRASPLPAPSTTRRSAGAATPPASIARALRSSLRLTLRLAQSTFPSHQAT